MRRAILCVLLLVVFLPGLQADQDVPVIVSESIPALAAAVNMSQLAVPELQGIAPWIANPLLLGAHLPLYRYNPGRAGVYTAAGIGLPAAGISMMMILKGNPVMLHWSGTLLTAYANSMYLSVYDTYSHSSGLKAHAGRLLSAPLSATIKDPLVWAPSIIAPAVLTLFYLGNEYEDTVSVGQAGHGYIGNREVSPVLAGGYSLSQGTVEMLAVSIGEEAYYRGVLYDQVRKAKGRRTAMILDALLFPLVHLPGDIQAGYKRNTIIFNFAWRSAMTLVFDAAYEKGGLPLSISAHFWSDLTAVMLRWWFYGGKSP